MGYKVNEEIMMKAVRDREYGRSIDEICGELGICRSTFYKYYGKLKKMCDDEEDRRIGEKYERMIKKSALSGSDPCETIERFIDCGLSSREKLERLRHVSEILTDRICEAASDDSQFKVMISQDKQSNIKDASVTSGGVTKKIDTKMIKDMASTVRVLTDCVRSLYGIPTFGESTRLYLAGRGIKEGDVQDSGVTVRFIDGIGFSE